MDAFRRCCGAHHFYAVIYTNDQATMQILNDVKKQIKIVLQLDDRFDEADSTTRLLGDIPELDSMAVVSLITALEDQFDIEFADDELHGEAFMTVGSLTRLVEEKLQEQQA